MHLVLRNTEQNKLSKNKFGAIYYITDFFLSVLFDIRIKFMISRLWTYKLARDKVLSN